MPIHVDIRVNQELVNQLHIARVKGGTGPEDINEYIIVEGDLPRSLSDWYTDGIPFQHAYIDGAEICVMRGIKALRGDGS
jgi:hypothetical protein